MRKVIGRVKWNWAAVAVAMILPSVIDGILEYRITQGVLGLPPAVSAVVNAVVGGLVAMIVLWFTVRKSPELVIEEESLSPPVLPEAVTEGKSLSPPVLPGSVSVTEEKRVPPPVLSEAMTEDKVFSPRTPAEMLASVEVPEIAAKDARQREIGYLLKVEGTIRDKSPSIEVFPNRGTKQVHVCMDELETQASIFLKFTGSTWYDRLDPFNLGDRISAIGRIESVTKKCVTLKDCELLGGHFAYDKDRYSLYRPEDE